MPANDRENGSVFWSGGSLQMDQIDSVRIDSEVITDLEAADGEDKYIL
jgi:hypothetical protein